MPSKVEKFKRKTEPKDVAKTYEASRSLQLESMSEILPNQSRLYADVKAKCESLGIKPMLISLYYAFACELAKKMAKFKGKTLMQEATALQIKYINKGLDSKVLSLIAHNMGVALDPSIEVHVINFPSEYPLPSSQVLDLKNVNANITNFPSEYPLPSSQISDLKNVNANIVNFPLEYPLPSSQITDLKNVNANVTNFPTEYPLPSSQISDLKNVNATVTNIPSEYPLPTSQVLDLKNVYVMREGSHVPFTVTLSAAGSQTIYTPSFGKRAQVLGFYVKCTSDVDWEVRFKSSLNIICGLPFKGAVLLNGIGLVSPIGGVSEDIEVYANGATTIKGWLIIKEV